MDYNAEMPAPEPLEKLTVANLNMVLTSFRNGNQAALPFGRDGKHEAVVLSAERYRQLVELEQAVAFEAQVASNAEELRSGDVTPIPYEDL